MPKPEPIWAIMPIPSNPEMSLAAISDLLAQSVPARLLLLNQGGDDQLRQMLERLAEEYPDRIFVWHLNPPLPSLSATWNRALDFCWEIGGLEAFVVNNDVRLHRDTIRLLSTTCGVCRALFVSAVGVTKEQFDPTIVYDERDDSWDLHGHGGPDFSCFLIERACHEAYRFDEDFRPAFCEDLDYHRRLLLDGQGERIFSINLPYLHYGSQTRKTLPDDRRAALDRAIEEGSRAHYVKKWGGPVNHERYTIPFDEESAQNGVTTPELQAAVQQSEKEPVHE